MARLQVALYRDLLRVGRRLLRHRHEHNYSFERAVRSNTIALQSHGPAPHAETEAALAEVKDLRGLSARLRQRPADSPWRPADNDDEDEDGFTTLRRLAKYNAALEGLIESGAFESKVRDSAVVHFGIGQVLVHKLFGRAVVTGWDKDCQMGEDWIKANGIDRVLKHGRNQPFFSLLLSDGTERYCSQENLKVEEVAKPVSHPLVNFYFVDWDEDNARHVPNEHMALRFPYG